MSQQGSLCHSKPELLGDVRCALIKTATSLESLNQIPVPEVSATMGGVSERQGQSVAGFLLMDPLLNPISFNAEAGHILGYPERLSSGKRVDASLIGKICSSLIGAQQFPKAAPVTEFRSGRRRYFCRTFFVEPGGKDSSAGSIAILLERRPCGLMPLAKISQQFNLTNREREALGHLLEGLSSKEIATRMNISTNTVKAFLRLTMIKTGVSSRCAIMGKVMMTQV